MVDELDPNKIAAEFLTSNMDRAIALVGDRVKDARDLIRLKLERTYGLYLKRLVERHSKAKSFFVRSEPVPLYDFFVPLDLSTQRRRLSSPGATEIAGVAKHAIIAGSGGSGKSMIMRHILLSALKNRSKTPAFVELRRVEEGQSLEDALLSSLRDNGLDIDADYLGRALRAGHFLVLLDGFDELDKKARKKFAKAIQAMVTRFPENWVVLTSRPDKELEGWDAFTMFRVDPLSLEKAVSLVERLTFDSEIKARFVGALRASLFARHESLLSNPLLLSIMLLTYQDTAHIPAKLSIFYNQAYESLFQKHDALKGGFQRPRETDLDIQDFARVFAAFCAKTYDKRQFTLSTETALATLDRCRALTRVAFESPAYLADARQAVCLLVDEGVDIAFAHRSFQEYFSARFVAEAAPELKEQLVKRFAARISTDEVIPLLHEIDPFAVEQHYVLPALERLREELKVRRTVDTVHLWRFMGMVFGELSVEPGSEHLTGTIQDLARFYALRFVLHRYQAGKRRGDSVMVASENKDLVAAFRAEFGEETTVRASAIGKEGPLIRALEKVHGFWGKASLQNVLDAEVEIRKRHAEAASSLDIVLS